MKEVCHVPLSKHFQIWEFVVKLTMSRLTVDQTDNASHSWTIMEQSKLSVNASLATMASIVTVSGI